MKFQVLIDYPENLDDGDRYKDHAETMPAGNFTKNTDYPSLEGETHSNHIKCPNTSRPINTTMIDAFPCVNCAKPRGLHYLKKNS